MMTAVGFLSLVQPTLAPGETIEVRLILSGSTPVRQFYTSVPALLAGSEPYYGKRHCYFGVATRRGRNGTAGGVSRAGTLWADVDAKLWPEAPDSKAAALAAIEAFPIRPGAVVDTYGGYQPYWPLTAPVDLTDPAKRLRLERLNRALARAICGHKRTPDHVQDAARVLRLPGSYNLKPEYGQPRLVVVLWCESSLRYSLEDLETALSQQFPWALQGAASTTRHYGEQTTTVPVHLSADLKERLRRALIRRETRTLLDSTGAAGHKSASEADMALACSLASAGFTESEALSLILTSPRGADAERRKGERHGRRYWEITVAAASKFIGPVIEQQSGGLRVRLSGTARPFRTVPAQEAARWLR